MLLLSTVSPVISHSYLQRERSGTERTRSGAPSAQPIEVLHAAEGVQPVSP